MAVAARVDPKSYFTPEEWAPLARRSAWIGVALVVHCWAVIGLCWAGVILASHYLGWFWPLTLLITTPIIGGRQLGLGILQHDAAHGALHPDPKVGDWISDVFCLSGVERYRKYHLQHHKFAQQAEDPDLGLSAPFPITRTSLRRKMVRDLTGQTWFKQRFGDFGKKLKARKAGEPALPLVWSEILKQRRWLLVNGAVILATSLAGYWWAWFLLWLLPRATWQMMITRFRNIAEHALVAKNEPDPLRHARSTHANLFERIIIAPYWVNYHCEHHMFMHVPCWNLPKVQRLMAEKGVLDAMLTAPGYWTVLKAAASRPIAAEPAGAATAGA
ncbi:MAG TPA: fatty acid desaturase family protein [Caulobacteraceae bacterium]|nr:fatty acid desaturase family protein [Caulobacteraceae bacterium]